MGTSATRAKNKYNEKTYDRFVLNLPIGKKEEYKKIAEERGKSLSAYIIEALEEKISREGNNA